LLLSLEALEKTERTLGKNHSDYAIRLNNLAGMYRTMGQYNKALPLYLEALQNIEKTLGMNHSDYGTCLNNLAGLYEAMGEINRAYALNIQGIALLMKQVEMNFSFIGEKDKELYSEANANSGFSGYRSFAFRNYIESPGFVKILFDAELFNAGLILNQSRQMQQRILTGGDESAKSLYERWMLLKSELARNYSKPNAERRRDLAEIEKQAGQLEGQLTRLSSTFAQYKNAQQLRWTDIRDRLEPGESAIQFSSFRYHDGRRWTDSTFYMALLLSSGDTIPQLVKLFEQKN
jgi:tetratricopeptide (TPR) repeat protein